MFRGKRVNLISYHKEHGASAVLGGTDGKISKDTISGYVKED